MFWKISKIVFPVTIVLSYLFFLIFFIHHEIPFWHISFQKAMM